MGRPVGISSDGGEGDGTGQRGVWPWGQHLGDLSRDLTGSGDAGQGPFRLSQPRRAGWLLCPAGDGHCGRASSLWPQVIPRGGSAERWPPHSLAFGGRSSSALKGRLGVALTAPTAGGAPRRGHGLFSQTATLFSSLLREGDWGWFWARRALYQNTVLSEESWVVWPEGVDPTLCSGLDSPGQRRTPHLPLVTPTAAFAGVGGLGLGLPTPVSPAPGKWYGGDEWAPSLLSDRPGSLLTG